MESNVQLIDDSASSENVEDKKDQDVDHLSGLEETCFSMIISHLDSESILTLSTVCSKIRERLSSMYLFSVTIPFSSEFLNYMQNNPYDVNKYVLSLKIVNPVPDSSQTLEEVVTSTSRQLMLLNISRVFAVSIKFAFNVSDKIREFRLAFLSFLQIVVNFKFVSKVHLSVYPEFLLNLAPEHLGLKCIRKLMMVKEFGLTFVPRDYQKKGFDVKNVQSMVEHFIYLLDVDKFFFSSVSNIDVKKLQFTNNKIKHLKLMVPQEFQYKVEMEKLESQILVFCGSAETYHVSSRPTVPVASDCTELVSSEVNVNLNNNNVVAKNVVDEKMMRDAEDLRNNVCPGDDDDDGTRMNMEVPEPVKCGDDGVLTLVPNPKEANPPTNPHAEAEHSNHLLKSQSFLEEDDDVKKIPDLTPKSTRHRRILKPRSVKLTKRPKKKEVDKTELIVKDPVDVLDSGKDKENVRLEDFNIKTSVLVPDSIIDIHKKTTKSPGKRKRKFVDDQGDKKHDQDDSKYLKITSDDVVQLGPDRNEESPRNSANNVNVNSKILVQIAKAKSSKSKSKSKFAKGKLQECKVGGKPKVVKKKTKVDKNGKASDNKETTGKLKVKRKTTLKEKKESKAKKPSGKSKIKIKESVHRRVRCGTCAGCLSVNCGSCRYCLDMICFGGNNKLRQACVDRTCIRKLAMMKDASDGKIATTKKKHK